MTGLRATALALACLAASAAWARGAIAAAPEPGLWDITLDLRVPDRPDFAVAPFQLQQCLTAADARDPSAVLGGLANPGASDCSYGDKIYSGDSFRFTMRCSGSYALRAEGEVTFSADRMQGTLRATANIAGERATTVSKISARRRGGC